MAELFNGNIVTTLPDDERIATSQPGASGSNNIRWSGFKTLLNGLYCRLTGTQTIAGVKTFTSSPQVPTPSNPNDAVNYQTLLGTGSPTKSQYADQTANFTHDLAADESLERIDLQCSAGTVNVKVGTSAGGDDVVSERTVAATDTKNKIIKLAESWKAAQTLYISVSGGGTVSVNIWYLPAIF